MLLLSDEDVRGHIDMATAIEKIKAAFLEQAAGTFIGPARSSLQAPAGKLIFAKGGAVGHRDDNANVVGFRVYPIFKGSPTAGDDQMVVVYEADNGNLKGIITGKYIGALRTGAINVLAADLMARQEVETLSVIGAGYQAQTQVQAVMAVRPSIEQIVIFSRTYSRAESMKQYLEQRFNVSVKVVDEAIKAVRAADILITATNSRTPTFKAHWLKRGTHINGIGPKFDDAHELPKEMLDQLDLIVTDSLAQIAGYSRPYFLGDNIGMLGLEKLVSGSHPGRRSDDEITFFSSTGLAGTEVVLANYLLDEFAEADK